MSASSSPQQPQPTHVDFSVDDDFLRSPPPQCARPPLDSDDDFLRSPSPRYQSVDEEDEAPQPPTKRGRTRRSELEKRKADLEDERRRFREYKKREHEAAMNAPRNRKPIYYNETQLRKQQERLEKERAAINWKSLSSKARKRNAKKKDDDVFVVESIDALRYCRDASCDYCLDYGRWMRQWYVKWEGYGPEHSSWEHAGNLDNCVELLTDAIFSAVGGADPESEEQCLLAFNGPEHDDDNGGEAPLQIALRDEVFPEPKRYDWMRFGGAPRPLPPAADPSDAANNRGTIYSGKKPPESFICKDGTVLEPVVVTSQVWAELQASFRRHKMKATVVREFMKLYQWHQRIQQSSGHNPNFIKGKMSDVRRQLETLGLFDEPAVPAEGEAAE